MDMKLRKNRGSVEDVVDFSPANILRIKYCKRPLVVGIQYDHSFLSSFEKSRVNGDVPVFVSATLYIRFFDQRL